jgi:hypothetical protein
MCPPTSGAFAETFASMVVQIEAREFHANQLISELRETQRQLEAAQLRLRQENTDLRFACASWRCSTTRSSEPRGHRVRERLFSRAAAAREVDAHEVQAASRRGRAGS